MAIVFSELNQMNGLFMKIINNLIGLILLIVAVVLILPLTLVNMIFVYKKYKSIDGYFRNTALNIDIWANREYRAFWNGAMRKENGYQFGVVGETISSALGKNQRDKTLTICGEILVAILDFLDKNHCQKSIRD